MIVQRRKALHREIDKQARLAHDDIRWKAQKARCEFWDHTQEPLKHDDPDFDNKWDEWMKFLR